MSKIPAGLRARWIVDPADHTGRRLIAVWFRPAEAAGSDTVPSTRPPIDEARESHLPSKRAVLHALTTQAHRLTGHEWPQAS